ARKTVARPPTGASLAALDLATAVSPIQPAPPLDDAPPGAARIVVDRPGMIVVFTEAPTRQFLVLSESFHHGWRLTVDGKRGPVYRAYGDFMGCLVPAGRHRVALRVRPASRAVGLWVSAVALAAAVGLPVVTASRGRARSRSTAVGSSASIRAGFARTLGPGGRGVPALNGEDRPR